MGCKIHKNQEKHHMVLIKDYFLDEKILFVTFTCIVLTVYNLIVFALLY